MIVSRALAQPSAILANLFLLCTSTLVGGCLESENAKNAVLVADAGADQSVRAGATVQLDGSTNGHPDGDTVSFQWSLATVPPGSASSLSDATGRGPRLIADLPGRYVIELVVNGDTASSSPDAVTVYAQGPPNVLVIVADDIGFGDVGPYKAPSSPVPTPNIDWLAAGGMVFTDAHAPTSVCAPTRYSVLTGNYPFRGRLDGGVWSSYAESMLLPGQTTAADVMRAAGYRTAFIGKWQQGGDYRLQGTDTFFELGGSVGQIDFGRPFEDGPLDHGFDYSFVLPSGIQAQPFAYFENDLCEPIDGLSSELVQLTAGPFNGGVLPQGGMGDPLWDSRQAGPRLAQRAVEFIDVHHRSNLDTGSSDPFFLLYMSTAIHKPWTPPESFDGTAVAGATGVGEKADMILELDLEVGAILRALEERELARETLVIFTSDNGGIKADSPDGHDSVGGLNGSKGGVHEGSHRVPFIAKWGDGTSEGSLIAPGSTCNELIGIHDYVAALYDLTRQDMPEEQALDSANVLPVLLGQQPANAPLREFLLFQSSNADLQVDRRGIRQGNWTLLFDAQGDPVELYDLANDLPQRKNLIDDSRYASLVGSLQAALQFALYESERTTSAFSNP